MYIQKITIKNFKSFIDETIEFCVPDGTNQGSGLNIFVGENNTGKTTVFAAILKLNTTNGIPEEERRGALQSEIILIDNEQKEKHLKNMSGSYQFPEKLLGESTINSNDITFVSSRRYWNDQFNSEMPYLNYKSHTTNQGISYQTDEQLPQLLANIEKTKKIEFTKIMQELIPDFYDWSVDKADSKSRTQIKYFVSASQKHSANALGDGVISLFRIAAHLIHETETKILIIDEPELSLHPQAQKKLFNFLKGLSRTKQILISTHSPYFIDPDLINNIYRFENKNHEGTKVHQINFHCENCKFKKCRAKKIKKLLWLENREIFFAKKVICIEGISDLERFRRFLGHNNYRDFFVVAGKENTGAVKEFCEAFNIPFISIFDLDKIGEKPEFIPNLEDEQKNKIEEYIQIEKVLEEIKERKEFDLSKKFLLEKVLPKIKNENFCLASKMLVKMDDDSKYKEKVEKEIVRLKTEEGVFVLRYGILENYLDENGELIKDGKEVEKKSELEAIFT